MRRRKRRTFQGKVEAAKSISREGISAALEDDGPGLVHFHDLPNYLQDHFT